MTLTLAEFSSKYLFIGFEIQCSLLSSDCRDCKLEISSLDICRASETGIQGVRVNKSDSLCLVSLEN